MRLTPAGRVMLAAAQVSLSGLQTGLDAASRAARGESGFVRVGFTPSIALTVLPPIVQAFRAQFPLVELQLSELPSAEQIEGVRTDRLDVALVRDPLPVAYLPSYVLLEERLVVLLPRAQVQAGNRRVALASLSGERFVTVRRRRVRISGSASFCPAAKPGSTRISPRRLGNGRQSPAWSRPAWA